jgi:hypothetical protein
MKIKVFYILSFLLICLSFPRSQAFANEKKELDFTQLIQTLTTQLKEIQKETNKEDAVVKLKECEIEIKWVWKHEAEGKISAWLVEGGSKYGKDEINTFRSSWEPVGDIYASSKIPEGLSNKIVTLENELQSRNKDFIELKSVLFDTLSASLCYYELLDEPRYQKVNDETPQNLHALKLSNLCKSPIFDDIPREKGPWRTAYSNLRCEKHPLWTRLPDDIFEDVLKKHKNKCDKCSQIEDKEIIGLLNEGKECHQLNAEISTALGKCYEDNMKGIKEFLKEWQE